MNVFVSPAEFVVFEFSSVSPEYDAPSPSTFSSLVSKPPVLVEVVTEVEGNSPTKVKVVV